MAVLSELSVELMLRVLRNVTIDDVFALRLTARSLRNFVDAHISSVAYGIARNTFPRARLLLRKPEQGVYDFRWLKSLVPGRLAAIVLDKDKRYLLWGGSHSTGDRLFDWLTAEDVAGDGARARVANGWRVLQRISNIYQSVYRDQTAVPVKDDNIPWALQHQTDKEGVDEIRRREFAVWIKAVSLILQLQPKDCQDLFLLFRSLAEAFRTQSVQEWRHTVYYEHEGPDIPYLLDCTLRQPKQKGACPPRYSSQLMKTEVTSTETLPVIPQWRHFDRGNTWLTAYILRAGASIFWEQWQKRPSRDRVQTVNFPDNRPHLPKPDEDGDAHYIRDRIRAAWELRSPGAIHFERECAAYIWNALFQRAAKKPIIPKAGYDSLRDSPMNHDPQRDPQLAYLQLPEYRNWDGSLISGMLSDSEPSWHERQQGKKGIDEHAKVDKACVMERLPGWKSESLQDQLFTFDSLDDINFYIWL